MTVFLTKDCLVQKIELRALKKYAKMLMHRIYNTLAYHLFVCGKQVKTDI
jgi:hypothetical protein